ncbi:hypothetical protein Tco_0155558 [Tanacetum coccineum]
MMISRTSRSTQYGHFKFTTKEDHENHLRLMLDLLRKEKLYAKFSKCEFWLQETFEDHEKKLQGLRLRVRRGGLALKIWEALFVWINKDVFYTSSKSLSTLFDQKELNMRQRRWLELFSDYECKIKYHPGKANVVADALSRKERGEARRVRAWLWVPSVQS